MGVCASVGVTVRQIIFYYLYGVDAIDWRNTGGYEMCEWGGFDGSCGFHSTFLLSMKISCSGGKGLGL